MKRTQRALTWVAYVADVSAYGVAPEVTPDISRDFQMRVNFRGDHPGVIA